MEWLPRHGEVRTDAGQLRFGSVRDLEGVDEEAAEDWARDRVSSIAPCFASLPPRGQLCQVHLTFQSFRDRVQRVRTSTTIPLAVQHCIRDRLVGVSGPEDANGLTFIVNWRQ